jgi:hypothetical protein
MATVRASLVLALTGCAAAAPPPVPPQPPPLDDHAVPEAKAPAPIAAGLDCIHATVRCDIAVCSAEVHNECPEAVDCRLEVVLECASAVVRRARGDGTFPVDSAATIEATADCGESAVTSTRAELLRCTTTATPPR